MSYTTESIQNYGIARYNSANSPHIYKQPFSDTQQIFSMFVTIEKKYFSYEKGQLPPTVFLAS